MARSDGPIRCFGGGDPLYERYHDEEWGVAPAATSDERELFERVSLEAFQSGLSWITILRKRDAFRIAFGDFVPAVVADFGAADVQRLLGDTGIVRNRAKISATINNARVLISLHEQGRRLAELFADHRPATRPQRVTSLAELPAWTAESKLLAKTLKGLGFAFVGPTTAYAAMQALGYVDDHLADCWRSAGHTQDDQR